MNLSLWRKRPQTPTSLGNGDLARLRDEMDRTFDRFLADPLAIGVTEPRLFRSEGWLPAIDVSETESEVTVRAEAPGIPAEDLDITVTGNTLTIAGQKDESTEERDESFYHCERRFGSFRRAIDLPDIVDADQVTAESDDGVVTIHLAKKPGVRSKQVEVKPISKKVPIKA